MLGASLWGGALLCLLYSQCIYGRFIVEEHSLTITSSSVRGTFQSAIANFGVPQYGGSMAGTVVYPGPGEKAKACQKFSEVYKAKTGELPNILLLDRGGCYFTEKVWQAQLAGASAVLVADDKDESLITMDAPEDDPETNEYIGNITIPSALIRKNTSDAIKKALTNKELVNVNMDWSEALPHPDDRVEYEFWTNSNDECGPKCDAQAAFVEEFKGIAQVMEQQGYVKFTPHYITWYCPESYVDSKQCKSQCINNGRYCAPDPEGDFEQGYDGKDVVVENLRELCVFKLANQTARPWLWWDYVTDFKQRCTMKDKKYDKTCAEKIISSLGLDVRRVQDCVGDKDRDADNVLLKLEQEAQVGTGQRSDVTILPTLVINQRQYRGKLDAKAVLKAICSGFLETTDPPQCLGKEIQTNECINSGNNGGCWQDGKYSACKDTFRGRVCQCPKDEVTGTVFIGDGVTSCKPAGPGRCLVNNGGCWSDNSHGQSYTACEEKLSGTGCKCPLGFSGDGYHCTDINECALGTVCSCKECKCKNTFGSYECSCSGNGLYMSEHDTCIGGSAVSASASAASVRNVGWLVTVILLACLAVVGVAGYVIYKYRIRSYMDSEIRAIMAQYMPLDSQAEAPNGLRSHEDI